MCFERGTITFNADWLVATLVRTIFAQGDRASALEQLERVLAQLAATVPRAAELLEDARGDLLAFAECPKEHWDAAARPQR